MMDPLITVAGNGYALVIEAPAGPVAIMLTRRDAERCFDNGVNYEPEIHGAQLEALQVIL